MEGAMADRDLKIPEFIRLYQAHGCTAYITAKQKVIVQRAFDGVVISWTQHAHKGIRDTFRRNTVRQSRFRLRFHEMPDDEFYAPLD
jgi:hypothetical protein